MGHSSAIHKTAINKKDYIKLTKLSPKKIAY